MAGAGAGAGAAAYTSMNLIVDIFTVALRITQMSVDSEYNAAGELVFNNLVVIDKSISCIKLFVAAYHATHTEGSEVFGYVCIVGFSLHSCAITNHLDKNLKAWARIRIVGKAVFMAAGASLLCRGMVIPKDLAWHTTVVHMIYISIVSLEAGMLVRSKINEDGGSKNLRRDLLITLADTIIAIYRFVDSVGKIQSPWDAEEILHLAGSGLPVMIGACHVSWITYKAAIVRVVVEWPRKMKIHRAFTGKEEQHARAAIEDDGDGDPMEKVVAKVGVEVVVVSA